MAYNVFDLFGDYSMIFHRLFVPNVLVLALLAIDIANPKFLFGEVRRLDKTQSAEELITFAVEYRLKSFKRGRVVIFESVSPRSGRDAEFLYETTFSGNNRKVIQKTRLPGDAQWHGGNQYVLNDNEFIDDFRSHADIVVNVTPRGDKAVTDQRFAFDPRAIGMGFGGCATIAEKGIDSFRKCFRGSTFIPVEESLNGMQTLRIEKEMLQGLKLKVWLAPEYDYSVVAASLGRDDSGHFLRTSYTKTADGHWFPHECSYEIKDNGKIATSYGMDVREARFDGDVDESEFRLEGLGLQPNRVVSMDTGNSISTHRWSGTKLEPYVGKGPGPITADETRLSTLFWVLIANAVALCSVAIWAATRLLKSGSR